MLSPKRFATIPALVLALAVFAAPLPTVAAERCSELFAKASIAAPRLMAKPITIIVSAPSGGGKSTLMQKLLAEFPGEFKFSVSTTTRAPRGAEQDGVEYHFTTVPEFKERASQGLFAEWAEVHGNFYGTSKAEVASILASGKSAFLDINVDGAATIRKNMPGETYSIFITPPDMKVLEERLRGRGTDSDEAIQKRMKNAIGEMQRAGEFDAVVVNDQIDKAYEDLKTVLRKAGEEAARAAKE